MYSVLCFLSKSALVSKKVCYKVSLRKNCQQQSCKVFTGLSICAKIVAGRRPLLPENFSKETHPFKNADFQSIFPRSAPAVTPSEKKFNNMNRKSTTTFPMSLRRTVYVVRMSPRGREGSETQVAVFVQNSNNNLR